MKKEGIIVKLSIEDGNASEEFVGKISREHAAAMKEVLHAFYDSENLKISLTKQAKKAKEEKNGRRQPSN
ncbi:MAG: hypothetical protein D4S01_06345 [Dehalococcoidia bacterium]|nr:MAG: hypothetical protein D4S01_06345 [Dehalococcoidia bacterium]